MGDGKWHEVEKWSRLRGCSLLVMHPGGTGLQEIPGQANCP